MDIVSVLFPLNKYFVHELYRVNSYEIKHECDTMVAFKAVLMGESGVGKTTLSRMLQNKNIEVPRKPTIGVDIEKVKSDAGNICVWDLAGQRRFQFMWDEFMKGSNLTILVTDSSPKNVHLTKDIMKRHLKNKGSKVIAIANKQDLKGRLSPKQIQEMLGVPTYGMIGVNHQNKNKLESILKRNL